MELCCHESRNIWGYEKLEEARREISQAPSEGAGP